jgi:hypothetical protein
MRFLTLFFIVVCLSLLSNETVAQVNVGITVVGRTLKVTYYPQSDYVGAPANTWSTQRVTIRFTDSTQASLTNLVNLSGFQFASVGLPKRGVNDNFLYQTFEANISPSTLSINFTAGQPIDIFTAYIGASKNTEFRLVTTPVAILGNATVDKPVILNDNTTVNEFGAAVFVGSQTLFRDYFLPVAPVCAGPVIMFLQCYSPITGLEARDFDVAGSVITSITPTSATTYRIVVTPNGIGPVGLMLRLGTVLHSDGTTNLFAPLGTIVYNPDCPETCHAEYYLEALNDGYYQVSLISNENWYDIETITATAQVTLKVGTSVGTSDRFAVTDLTMMLPGVTWVQNSRYDAPAENPAQDYISFGLTSYGTSLIPYVEGDTVPLFRFKNTGICSGDSVYLMPVTGDAFAYPNSLNANVGQQLTVNGHNQPDVPLCVSGVAPCMAEVTFDFKALLQGAYVSADGLMHDKLREQSLVPTTEPYTGYTPVRGSTYAPFVHKVDGGGEVIASSNVLDNQVISSDNIVDWVVIELRSNIDSSVVSTRSALVQRDGDIRDTLGNDLLVFRKLEQDKYYFTVRHRNHLGLMSALPVPLTNVVNGYDFSNPLIAMLGEDYTIITVLVRPGDPLVFSRYPGVMVDGKRLLWAGNSNADNYIMFQGGGIGEGLDIDNVFDNIFSDPLNANYSYNHVRDGYYPGDNNLDGKVKYQGPANDVDPFIFFNIISRHPDNVNKFVNFYITEGIPRD